MILDQIGNRYEQVKKRYGGCQDYYIYHIFSEKSCGPIFGHIYGAFCPFFFEAHCNSNEKTTGKIPLFFLYVLHRRKKIIVFGMT